MPLACPAAPRLRLSETTGTFTSSGAMQRIVAFLMLIVIPITGRASDPVDASLYESKIKPILANKCYACHGALQQEAGLRLETVAVMLAGGDSGPAIVPGQADESMLVHRISGSQHERMPPPEEGTALPASDIELIKQWIREGAHGPDEELPASPGAHWAFQAIVRPELPRALDSGSIVAHPIDRFLTAARGAQGLMPQAKASRETRLRRLYLDLIGLPPTCEQLKDARPWEAIADELLASPQHAERWARHWMDVWRYSDWYGLGEQLRNSSKHLWRWRDWIVKSLHQDKPYDRMIHEMLAGDELAPEDAEVVVATGYLARNYYLFNRTTWLDDTIEHTAKAFMGLTLNCAKCHDHKYDPLSQVDYYRFRAIFEPHQVRLDPVPGSTDFSADGLPRVFDDHLDLPTRLHRKGDPKQPDESVEITPAVPAIFGSFAPSIAAIELPPAAWAPGIRPFAQADRIRDAEVNVKTARDELTTLASAGSELQVDGQEQAKHLAVQQVAAQKLCAMEADLAALKATCEADNARYLPPHSSDDTLSHNAALRQAEAQLAHAVWELEKLGVGDQKDADETKRKATEERLQKAEAKLAAVAENGTSYESLRASQKLLETPEHKDSDYAPIYPSISTGRRLALARWLTAAEHPLTARVAVNHLWMRHMGQPLVENVFDFGLRTPRPPLADLLDYLAAEFIESGWSQRHMHRLIVTSTAYQLDSSARSGDLHTVGTDPLNQYYWRANVRRMESQVIRDSLLYIAGNLDLTVGGPSVSPDQPNTRRGIYLKHSRDHQDKLQGVFDDADHLQCYRRSESIIPQQALALANSHLAIDSARRVAERLVAESALEDGTEIDWAAFIRAAYQTVLGRLPNDAESAVCVEFCHEHKRLVETPDPSEQATRTASRLVHVLLNHNDFLTIR